MTFAVYVSGHIMRCGIYVIIHYVNTMHVPAPVSARLPTTRPPLVPLSL